MKRHQQKWSNASDPENQNVGMPMSIETLIDFITPPLKTKDHANTIRNTPQILPAQESKKVSQHRHPRTSNIGERRTDK